MKINALELLSFLQQHLGPWRWRPKADVCRDTIWHAEASVPIYIFDFLGMESNFQDAYVAIVQDWDKFPTLDDVFFSGESGYSTIGVGTGWGNDGLVPIATITSDDDHFGPLRPVDGLLLMDAARGDTLASLPVIAVDFKSQHVVQIADGFGQLDIGREDPDRELSERIKTEGNQAFQSGDLDEAIDSYQRAIVADYTNPNPYNNLGMAYRAKGDDGWRLAAEFFRTSYLIDPSYTNGMRGYAGILCEMGEFTQAVQILDLATETCPDDVENYICLAEIKLDLEKIEEAKQACQKALALQPDHPRLMKVNEKISDAQ